MKKTYSIILLAAMVLLGISCAKETGIGGNKTGDVTVQVSASLPINQAVTKAFGDGLTAKKLSYAVYLADGVQDGVLIENGDDVVEFVLSDGKIKATFSVTLSIGKTYDIALWADKGGDSPYKFDAENKKIVVDTDNAVCSNDEWDAFYAKVNFTAEVGVPVSAQLYRPFAQINVGTDDLTKALKSYSDLKTSVVADSYKEFDLLSSKPVGDAAQVTFASASPQRTADQAFPVSGYEYLAMAYVLVDDEATIDVTYNIYEGDTKLDLPSRSLSNVPVKTNYRTNIFGSLLTSDIVANVVIEPAFGEPDYADISIWNGSSMTSPELVEGTTNQYIIKDASQLAGLAALTNGTFVSTKAEPAEPQAFQGCTFTLGADIDLAGCEWTPIGNNSDGFKGVFDGNGYTISNLKVSGSNSYVGLFGSTYNGEIKNLTIENAEVSGYLGVGVVAGKPYTSKYSNITVKGLVKVDGFAYVGGVGGRNAYADWNNITVDVENGSYVNANSISDYAYRSYVGGVIGFCGEGEHTFSNITSNIKVTGTVCDVGGITGIAHYNNKFINCLCSATVWLKKGDIAEGGYKEIGGIAGVWHNENGTSVTFTNCKFSGTLRCTDENNKSKNSEVAGNQIVGPKYSSTSTGTLVIDGDSITSGQQLEAVISSGETNIEISEGNYAITSKTSFAEGTSLKGEGSDKTVITVARAENAEKTTSLTVTSSGVSLSDITLDGQYVYGESFSSTINIEAPGCSITDAVIKGGGSTTWSSSVLVEKLKKGESFTISRTTISGAFRGILAESQNGDIYVNNCDITATYPISIDGGGNFGLYVNGGTLRGWTSFSVMAKGAHFTNVTFEKKSYNCVASYCDTEFNGCTFKDGFALYCQDPNNAAGRIYTITDCTYDGVAITSENAKACFAASPDVWNKATLIVNGVTILADVTE